MEWLHLLLRLFGIESTISDLKYYNITLSVAALGCKNELEQNNKNEKDTKTSAEKIQNTDNIMNRIISFFTSLPANQILESKESECESVFQFTSDHYVSSFIILWLVLFGIFAFIFLIFYILAKLSFKILGQVNNKQAKFLEETRNENNVEVENTESKNKTKQKLNHPLIMRISKIDNQSILQPFHPMALFLEGTINRFLKELDLYLSVELSLSMNGTMSASGLPFSPQSSLSSITSPRLSRKLTTASRQSPKSLPANSLKKIDESSMYSWIKYEKLKQRFCWNHPSLSSNDFDFRYLSNTNKGLCVLLQFLQQNCTIKPQQWTIATMIVNYCLFTLEEFLKSNLEECSDFYSFSKFESIGSATEGTLISLANRFDVLMVLDPTKCPELNILHSNNTLDIPAGHVALCVKDCDNATSYAKFTKKACIENKFGNYLVPKEFEETADNMLKKCLQRLNREYKIKMDSLPFDFHLSCDKKLTLKVDTRLLNSLGLGLEEIYIKIIPAVNLSLPECSMLSPVYAIPPMKDSNKFDKVNSTFPKSTLSHVLREQKNEDFLWCLCTEQLKMNIIKHFDNKLYCSGVQGCHRELVMLLKALFSHGHKNKLLNKGEVESNILSTVVYFLLQESSPSSWILANLPDRLSDAVHFLKSAYENNFLPSFLVHNPHLLEQCPALEVLAPLLSGKQQNLLANISSEANMKVMEFIDTRLQETGLSQCMKEEFSTVMWEYEFFIFC